MLDTPTFSLLSLALDATAMRHLTIADSIANAASPNYGPKRVNFEEQLALVRQSIASGEPLTPAALADVEPRFEAAPRTAGQAANSPTGMLDLELVRLAQNTLHYQALLRGVNRYISIMSTAVSEGRK
jgi:flagellar basal-body rod protein FlgB